MVCVRAWWRCCAVHETCYVKKGGAQRRTGAGGRVRRWFAWLWGSTFLCLGGAFYARACAVLWWRARAVAPCTCVPCAVIILRIGGRCGVWYKLGKGRDLLAKRTHELQ